MKLLKTERPGAVSKVVPTGPFVLCDARQLRPLDVRGHEQGAHFIGFYAPW